jgi:hypothetical protein
MGRDIALKLGRRDPTELLAFAGRIIERAVAQKIYGRVIIHIEGGTITRAQTEVIELAPKAVDVDRAAG